MGSIKRLSCHLVVFLLLLIFLPSMGVAGQFRVKPIKIYFNPKVKISSFQVVNLSSESVAVQMSVVTWNQNEEGKDIYQPTKDLLVFPRIVTLKGNGSQVVRIAYRGRPVTTEGTYRLFVEEIPVAKPGKNILKVTLRLGMPVFVDPIRPSDDWKITGVTLDEKGTRVSIENKGNRHMMVRKITVTGRDANGGESFTGDINGWYVLAGNRRKFSAPVTMEQCLATQSVHILASSVDNETREFESKVKVDPSRCPPQKADGESVTGKSGAAESAKPPPQ